MAANAPVAFENDLGLSSSLAGDFNLVVVDVVVVTLSMRFSLRMSTAVPIFAVRLRVDGPVVDGDVAPVPRSRCSFSKLAAVLVRVVGGAPSRGSRVSRVSRVLREDSGRS